MDIAKIQLSEEEYGLVQNADWHLMKNNIVAKVYEMFGMLAAGIKNNFADANIDADIFRTHAKISKGENYKGFPYVMLDYPRCFGKQDVFALRNFFWWGNYFSTSLHLKGIYKQNFSQKIAIHLHELKDFGFFISIRTDEWRHDFESDNYASLTHYSKDSILEKMANDSFCKIAARVPLKQFNIAFEHL